MCTLLVAFSFALNLFPVYSALKHKSNENCNKAVSYSMYLVTSLYFVISYSSIFLFGKNIESPVTNNVNEEEGHWESYMLRVLFMIVIACHIPFIFFSGKESLLIIIDEIDRRSISSTLEERVKGLQIQEKYDNIPTVNS